jgi:hypothetical protein
MIPLREEYQIAGIKGEDAGDRPDENCPVSLRALSQGFLLRRGNLRPHTACDRLVNESG